MQCTPYPEVGDLAHAKDMLAEAESALIAHYVKWGGVIRIDAGGSDDPDPLEDVVAGIRVSRRAVVGMIVRFARDLEDGSVLALASSCDEPGLGDELTREEVAAEQAAGRLWDRLWRPVLTAAAMYAAVGAAGSAG